MDINDIFSKLNTNNQQNSLGNLQSILPLLSGNIQPEKLTEILGKNNPNLGLILSLMQQNKNNNQIKKNKRTFNYVKVQDYYKN